MTPDEPFLEPAPARPAPTGSLDWPPAGAAVERGAVTLHGWMLFPEGVTATVELWLGDHPLGRARLGLPRRDVSDLTGNPRGMASGFEMKTNLANWPGPDGESMLRTIATSVAGERFELPETPVTVGPEPPVPAPGALLPPAPRTPEPVAGNGPRTLVCTHQLDLGGAQLFLVDLLRNLIELETIEPTVVSAIDGPVRGQLEDLGIPVHISGSPPVRDLSSYIGRVEELHSWAAPREFDLVLINTATAHALPGAEVAEALGIPAVWLIHESFEPAVLWDDFEPRVRRRAEGILAGADAAVFVAEATRRIYQPLIGAERTHTIPYGLDLGPIEVERATVDRTAVRREIGIPEDADVLFCPGTVEPRKAQVPLALAFDLIAPRHPRAELLVVGGRDDDYAHLFEELAGELDSRDRIRLLPITPDVHRWFAASDLLVCASDIESLPRTVLEAIAWEKPVLSTGVFGLPELIDDGETGWLCEHSDIASLAAGLERALSSDEGERRRIAAAARERLAAHDPAAHARRIAELLAEVGGGVAPRAGSGRG